MKDENLPLVTVVIPVLNEEKHIRNCLEDVLNQDYPRDKIEVLIVDGNSKDKTKEAVQEFIKQNPSFRTALQNEIGKSISAAMNIGLKSAKGDIIMKMDAHTKYELNYISKGVEFLQKTNADCVGGPIRPRGTNYKTQAVSFALKTFFGSGGGKFHQENYDGYADTVFLGAYKKESLIKIKGWDETIVDEDQDLNYRLIKNGGKIYLTSEIRSYYYVYPTLKRLWKLYFQYGYIKLFFMKKHRILGAWHHIIPFIFLLGLAGSLLLGFIFRPFWVLFILISAAYLIASFSISFRISLKEGLKYFLILPIIFPIIHFGYAFGFFTGFFNAFLLGKEQ